MKESERKKPRNLDEQKLKKGEKVYQKNKIKKRIVCVLYFVRQAEGPRTSRAVEYYQHY